MKKKKLNLPKRLALQVALSTFKSAAALASDLGYSRVTISNELKNNSIKLPLKEINGNLANFCSKKPTCDTYAKKHRCSPICKEFELRECEKLNYFPFVCNNCPQLETCHLQRKEYRAVDANNTALEVRINSHKGPLQITENELKSINELVSPYLKKGISVEVIYDQFKDSIPISLRTFRHYINNGYFDAKNIDLARTVQQKKPQNSEKRIKKSIKSAEILIGRTYSDYKEYIKENSNKHIFEIDTVIGTVSSKKCLLTIYERKSKLQFGVLVNHNSNDVYDVFDKLKKILGEDNFNSVFNILLTDNGTEFARLHEIEGNKEGHCRVFFCDPYCSFQKGGCERNHEFFRYFVPKGVSFDDLNQEDISAIMSNINSYPRSSLHNSTPYKEFIKIFGGLGKIILNYFGIVEIPFEKLSFKK